MFFESDIRIMQQYLGGGEEAWRRNQFLEANKPTAQSSAGRDNITKEIGKQIHMNMTTITL